MRSLSSHSASSSWFDGTRLEVVGAVEVGGAVDVGGAGGLEQLEVRVGGDVLRALEHHVLEQVREAGAARHLVGRADVVPEVDRDQRQPLVLREDDLEAVRQRERRVFEARNTRRCHGTLAGRRTALARGQQTGEDQNEQEHLPQAHYQPPGE